MYKMVRSIKNVKRKISVFLLIREADDEVEVDDDDEE